MNTPLIRPTLSRAHRKAIAHVLRLAKKPPETEGWFYRAILKTGIGEKFRASFVFNDRSIVRNRNGRPPGFSSIFSEACKSTFMGNSFTPSFYGMSLGTFMVLLMSINKGTILGTGLATIAGLFEVGVFLWVFLATLSTRKALRLEPCGAQEAVDVNAWWKKPVMPSTMADALKRWSVAGVRYKGEWHDLEKALDEWSVYGLDFQKLQSENEKKAKSYQDYLRTNAPEVFALAAETRLNEALPETPPVARTRL